jgi:hypothetical protein
MATKAYNLPGTVAPNAAGLPKPSSMPLQEDGTMARDWWRFFLALVSKPPIESTVVLGASPTTYTASVNGTLLVAGTVSAMTLASRGSTATYTLPATGYIPLSIGDVVTLTYTGSPTVMFFPR